jgi:hypothetical protein
MRIMLRVTIPVEQGNKAIKDGSLARTFQSFIEEHKPEAAYFYPHKGQRTGVFYFDLKDTTDIPKIVEPPFHYLNAEIEVTPVMNAEDLKVGLSKVKL